MLIEGNYRYTILRLFHFIARALHSGQSANGDLGDLYSLFALFPIWATFSMETVLRFPAASVMSPKSTVLAITQPGFNTPHSYVAY